MGLGKSTTSSDTTGQTTGTSQVAESQLGTRDPFAAAIPGIESLLAQAQGLEGQRGLAAFDPALLQAADEAQRLSGQTGFLTDPAVAAAQQGFAGAGVGTDTLTQFAQGNFGANNLDQVIANRQLDTSDVIRRMTAGAGRSGSPAETGILARELGKIGLEAELGQRSGDLGRQATAAEALSGRVPGLIGQIPGLQQGQEFGINLLERAGLIRQGASQQEIDSVLRNIQSQQGIIQPLAQLGGTTSQTGTRGVDTTGTTAGTAEGTANASLAQQFALIGQGIGGIRGG